MPKLNGTGVAHVAQNILLTNLLQQDGKLKATYVPNVATCKHSYQLEPDDHLAFSTGSIANSICCEQLKLPTTTYIKELYVRFK